LGKFQTYLINAVINGQFGQSLLAVRTLAWERGSNPGALPGCRQATRAKRRSPEPRSSRRFNQVCTRLEPRSTKASHVVENLVPNQVLTRCLPGCGQDNQGQTDVLTRFLRGANHDPTRASHIVENLVPQPSSKPGAYQDAGRAARAKPDVLTRFYEMEPGPTKASHVVRTSSRFLLTPIHDN
jgi:hypothetical protein